jgi:hypothetical protein
MKIVCFIGGFIFTVSLFAVLIVGFQKTSTLTHSILAQEGDVSYEAPYQGPGRCHNRCQKPAG